MALLPLLVPVSTQAILVSSLLCFTDKNSLLRYAGVPLIALLTYQACQALDLFSGNQLVNPLTSGFIFGFAVHHVYLLCIAKIDNDALRIEATRDSGKDPATVTTRHKFTAALYLLSTVRGVKTAWEIRNLDFPSDWVARSRFRFLAWNLVVLAGKYLILDFITSQKQSEEEVQEMFGQGREWLLFRPDNLPAPTLQEGATHFFVAFMGWGSVGAWFVDVFYRIAALASVGLGVSRPDEWPSLFGSVLDAYTLRRFWGYWWHQLFRWPFQGTTNYICRDILHLPRKSLLERYINIVLVFAISTSMHIAIDAVGGVGPDRTGALMCFMLQPLGIAFEDFVQATSGHILGKHRTFPPWLYRTVGYLWVWTFMTLVAPLYNFPLMRYQDPNKNGVPISIVKHYQNTLG